MCAVLTRECVLSLLREKITYDVNITKLAKKYGVSQPFMSDVLKGKKHPNEAMLKSVGVRRIVTYERIK